MRANFVTVMSIMPQFCNYFKIGEGRFAKYFFADNIGKAHAWAAKNKYNGVLRLLVLEYVYDYLEDDYVYGGESHNKVVGEYKDGAFEHHYMTSSFEKKRFFEGKRIRLKKPCTRNQGRIYIDEQLDEAA